jgi:ferric-dicitrate binding protein FerR (iron transport regulator)
MHNSIEIEEIAACWLARSDSQTWGVAEQSEFEAWIEASTAHRVAFLRLQAAWQRSGRLGAVRLPEPACEHVLRSTQAPSDDGSLHRISDHVTTK